MIGQETLHPVDAQRLADVQRTTWLQRTRGHLPREEIGGFISVIAVLLKRHGGNADHAQDVAAHLLQHALTSQTLAPVTIGTLLKVAREAQSKPATAHKAAGQRR